MNLALWTVAYPVLQSSFAKFPKYTPSCCSLNDCIGKVSGKIIEELFVTRNVVQYSIFILKKQFFTNTNRLQNNVVILNTRLFLVRPSPMSCKRFKWAAIQMLCSI